MAQAELKGVSHSCVAEVLQVMGNTATAKQIQGWVDKLQKIDPDPRTLTARVQEYGEEALRKAYLKKRNTALLLQKEAAMVDFVSTNFRDNPAKGMQAFLVGIQSDMRGSRASVALAQESLQRRYLNGLQTDLQRSGVMEDFRSGDLDDLVARELEDLGRAQPTGKATTSPKAKEIARIVRKHQDYARNRANEAGADIGDLEGYITTQTHDMFKIRKVSEEQWVAEVSKRIDFHRTFGDSDLPHAKLLRDAYRTFATGDQFRAHFGDPVLTPINTTTNIGGSMSKHRVLHFKSADDWIAYNKLYGKGSLRENIWDTMSGMANRTGMMEMMGPNPEEAFNRAVSRIGHDLGGATAAKLSNSTSGLQKYLSVLDGSANIPGNPVAAKYGQVFRAVQSMAKLGGAVVSAVSDIPIAASELRYQGQGFLDSYHSSLLGSFNNIPKAHRRELAMQLGVFFDAQNASMTERLSGREDFSGRSSRALGTFFKYSGLTAWTDRMRANAGLAMSARLGGVSNKQWAQLEPELQRVFGLYNIDDADWRVMRSAAEKVNDHTFITPEGIQNLPDNVLDAKGRDVLADKLRSYFTDRVDHAVITPDARTTTFLKQGTRPGTVEGEFFRMVAQFKAFPVAVLQKVMGREIYGRGKGGWKTGSGMMGIAHVITMSTAFGYVAMSAKDMLKGRQPRDPQDPATWAAAMLQGGALGLYGDFILGANSRYGQSVTQSLAGPGIGLIEEAVKVLQAAKSGEDPSAQAFRTALANTPYANLFYTRAALDYLIFYRIQEALSPGYLSRMERNIQQNNNQEFMVKPSSVIPRGGF